MLYVTVGFFAYLLYLHDTEVVVASVDCITTDNLQGDLLNNLGTSKFDESLRLLFALAIVFHYPLVNYGFR